MLRLHDSSVGRVVDVLPRDPGRIAMYICGPTGFVEMIAERLVMAGHDPSRIKTERFGPT